MTTEENDVDEENDPENECGICGEDHDDTDCTHEECRLCGEVPDNCDCEGPEDRWLVGVAITNHYVEKLFGHVGQSDAKD